MGCNTLKLLSTLPMKFVATAESTAGMKTFLLPLHHSSENFQPLGLPSFSS